MSACISCLKKYGIFNKEVGCPNCKFSFCSKCLKHQIEVPQYNGAKKKVCFGCFEKLSNPIKYGKKSTPVAENLLDQTFKEEEKLPPPVEIDKDKLIADKLEALKKKSDEEDKPQTDEDIAARLARLRGMNHKDYSQNTKSLVNMVDTRTDQEKINDLLKQFEEESNLNENYNTSKKDASVEIEEKLAHLKGEQGTSGGVKYFTDVLGEQKSEAETIKRIVAEAMEESRIDDNLSPEAREYLASVSKPVNPADEEELPWCTICNEDAIVRCLDCDGDLFCRSCFREVHEDDEDYRVHRTKSYVKPNRGMEEHN